MRSHDVGVEREDLWKSGSLEPRRERKPMGFSPGSVCSCSPQLGLKALCQEKALYAALKCAGPLFHQEPKANRPLPGLLRSPVPQPDFRYNHVPGEMLHRPVGSHHDLGVGELVAIHRIVS